ncbi:MAG: nickel transporter, partial [Rhizobiaceae bacterium]|nr:nickel transporter [Rhizobiaceae bacterium]
AAGATAVFAAGGVRDEDDLMRLEKAGIAGALVASALHDGRIDRAVLERMARLPEG